MSDADGAIVLPSKLGWQAPVSVHVDGYLDARSSVDDVHRMRADALSIELHPVVSLDVRLIGDFVGAGTHEIGVSSPEADFEVQPRPVDESGVARFDAVPAEASLWIGVRVEHRAWRWLSQDVRLRAREPAVLEFPLGGGATIRGIVLDSRTEPVPGCPVVLVRTKPGEDAAIHYVGDDDVPGLASGAKTDTAGRFELTGVLEGAYWLGTMPEDDLCANTAELVTVPSSGNLEVTLSCRPGFSISGHTLSPSGRPEAADVELRGTDIDVSMHSLGFGDNTFSFDGLAAGRYRLRADGNRYFAASAWLEVEAGTRDVVLRLTEGATIRGLVSDAARTSIEQASVEAFSEDGSTAYRSDVRLPDFELTGVPAGSCVVTATTPDGRTAVSRPIEVARGAVIEGVRLHLEQAAALEIALPVYAVYRVVVSLEGCPIAVEGEVFGDAVLRVPARELEVRAEYRGRVVARRTVAPRAGELLEVDLRVE